MNEAVLFGIGSILFILLTWATLMFLYLRFNEAYRRDQPEPQEGAEAVLREDLKLLSTPNHAGS